jgi:hypothetical protein
MFLLSKLFGGAGRTGGGRGRGGCGGIGCIGLIIVLVLAFFVFRSCGGDIPAATDF